MKRPVRALSGLWTRWDVVLWSLDREEAVMRLGSFPWEWMACLRARFWLARRAYVQRSLPIVMRRAK